MEHFVLVTRSKPPALYNLRFAIGKFEKSSYLRILFRKFETKIPSGPTNSTSISNIQQALWMQPGE